MPNIIIDGQALRRGLYSDRVGLATSQETPAGYYVRSNGVDLHRVGFEGHITPAQTFSAGSISNAAINSLPRAVAVDISASTPNVYWLLGGLAGTAPRIVKIISDAYSATSVTIASDAGDNFTTLPSTGFWGEDIVIYKVVGTAYVFYSWNDNDDGDVGRMTLAGASNDDDWMSTEPDSGGAKLTAAVPHRMVEGANGKLYITNGRYVAEFDGTTGTDGVFDASAYDAGLGWVTTDVRRFGDYLVIASIKTGGAYIKTLFSTESRVAIWDMNEPGLGRVYDVQDNFLSAVFPVGGRLYAFTEGRNNTVKVHRFPSENQEFKVIWESAVYTSSPDPRSVDVYKGLLVWSSAGNILALDLETEGIHQPFLANDGTDDVTTIGFLKNIDQSKFSLGGLFAGTYKSCWLTFASTGFGTAKDLRTRLNGLPYKAIIKKLTVFFSQMASGGSATFSLFKNYATMSVGGADDLLNQVVSFAANGTVAEFEKNVTITGASAVYLNVRVTGQVSVRAIVVDWDYLK